MKRYFIACLCAGFFISAHAESQLENNAIAWAREQQRSQSLIQPLKNDIEQIKSKSMNNQMDTAWIKKQLNNRSVIASADEKSKINPQGVNIDALLKRYAIPMQSYKGIVEQQHLYLFVSFSMPEQSLKTLLKQAQQVNGILVIRGLINQSLKETTQIVAKLLDGQKGGLQIDPSLFKKFNISQVPAVVVIDKNCTDIIYGDIPLIDSLEAIEQNGDCKAQAKQFLTTLRPSL